MIPSRRWVIGLISALLLFGLGLGSFWWGLNLVSDVPEVTNAPDPPSQVAVLPPPETTEVAGTESEIVISEIVGDEPSEMVPSPTEAVSDTPPDVTKSDSLVAAPTEQKAVQEKVTTVSRIPEGESVPPVTKKTEVSVKEIPPLVKKEVVPGLPAKVEQKPKVSSPTDAPPKVVQRGDKKVLPPSRSPAASKPFQEVAPSRPKRVLSKEQKLVLAQRLINKHRYDQAVTVLDTVMTSSPEEWEPWFWMGTAKLGQGNVAEADGYFIEGLARNGNIPQLWVQRALVGQQEGRYGEAIDFLRQAEILAPDLPEIPLNLAYSFETQGDRQLAIQHYRKFLTMTEGNSSYRSARKTVLIRVDHLNQT
jgi:hypothetical protein